MYDSNGRLTLDGAKAAIAAGGSVLIKGQLHNDVRTLPNAAQMSAFNAVTRQDAEAAINAGGTFTFQGKTYSDVDKLPSAEEFAAKNREAAAEAREQLQKEIDDRQRQLDEADRLSAEANAKSAQADAIRSGRARGGAAGTPTGADAETFGHGDNQYPLSHFDGMTDEQVLEVPGVGEATLKDIRKAQKKANRQ
jgi:hypothetical protein